MDHSSYSRLREKGWRQKLTSEEKAELRAWLAAHPELHPEWEDETALNEFLSQLPDVALPTNFTARVLAAATADSAIARRRVAWRWGWRSFLPRAALAGVVLILGTGIYRYHETSRRLELAHRIVNVSDMAALSNPEALQDFETVRHLNQTPTADEELLALLQ